MLLENDKQHFKKKGVTLDEMGSVMNHMTQFKDKIVGPDVASEKSF